MSCTPISFAYDVDLEGYATAKQEQGRDAIVTKTLNGIAGESTFLEKEEN